MNRFILCLSVTFLCFIAAFAQSGNGSPQAYVANACSNTVSVIDTATNTVVATIPAGGCPSGIAITPQARVPTSIEQCKDGGFRTFGPPAGPFRNQGECVSYVQRQRR
ncbi:MAG: hypothetical protein M3R15_11590 [Acidobacteriota bacterium]|nr:hypothetical protein [Acidobacteriota bacterium]